MKKVKKVFQARNSETDFKKDLQPRRNLNQLPVKLANTSANAPLTDSLTGCANKQFFKTCLFPSFSVLFYLTTSGNINELFNQNTSEDRISLVWRPTVIENICGEVRLSVHYLVN